ncbi:hypothetical protein [Alistipes putredinis]|jgi:hypothetical protein|uniref:hypothetical protein n=1 Tax=Alistipes putredinis TaxID=28117 RepID=UPI00307AEF6D
MARLKIRYNAVDPYYSTHEQTFIGVNLDDCDNQRFEYEQWLGREHPSGIMTIFKPEILEERP